LSAAEFERFFLRERELADRHETPFSLLLFMPVDERQGGAGLADLARVLTERLRSADVIGYLDERHLAALLSFTQGQGAWQVADDVLSRLARLGHRFDCRVLAYPSIKRGSEPEEPTKSDAGSPSATRPGGDQRGRTDQRQHRLRGKPIHSRAWGGSGNGTLATIAAQEAERARARRAAAFVPSEYLEMAHVRSSAGPRPVGDLEPLLIERFPLWKRLVDIAVSATALVVLSPVLLVIAILVKLSSPGPVIYVQPRAGVGGRPFPFYKFRSMVQNADQRQKDLDTHNEKDGPIFKMRNDPRITPLGRVLRRWSLDELPQLFNVLKGDMTLIGPRPPKLNEVAEYRPWHRRRLTYRGGLTCIWQVSGRSEVGFEDWMRMDVQYIKRRDAVLDFSILARTLRAVVSARGAY
jgi:lipopolysaccharide/colanic/teichoic acid biosynthesis glycosyltransferase